MPRTPDRNPGVSDEEGIVLSDEGVEPAVVGEVRYNGGAFRMRDGTGVFDPRTGGSGLSPAAHRALDQLVHPIAEDSYEEYIYSGIKVTDIIVWTDSGKTQKIRETTFTYSGNKVSTVVTKQYDGAGVLIVGETMTETFTYSGNQVSNIDRVMT
jgi:hypothetical protein